MLNLRINAACKWQCYNCFQSDNDILLDLKCKYCKIGINPFQCSRFLNSNVNQNTQSPTIETSVGLTTHHKNSFSSMVCFTLYLICCFYILQTQYCCYHTTSQIFYCVRKKLFCSMFVVV